MGPRHELEAIRSASARGDHAEAARLCLALLQAEPRNVEATLEYGHLAVAMRRLGDAVLIFRKLLAFSPDNTIAHDRLAYLYRVQGDYPNAEKHARQALAVDASLVNSRLALGSIAIARGDSAAALQIFDSLRAELPDDLHIDTTYAEALLRLGEFSRARELILGLLDRYPQSILLYTLLSRCGKLAEGSDEARLIAGLAGRDGELAREFADPEDRIRAYMALFKLQYDLAHPSLAFRYLQRAKALRSAQIPYRPEETVELNRQLTQLFHRELPALSGEFGAETDAPVFIVAMPRSGTTLLERMLATHPELSPAGELLIVGQLVQELCAHFGQNQYDLAALGRIPPRVWREAGQEYVQRARQLVGDARYFSDKMPDNYLWLGFIRAALPNARIIHLSRHPIDNCLSIYEQDFATPQPWANDLDWLGGHYVAYRSLMAHWRSIFGGQLIEVSYEEITRDPVKACGRLGDALGFSLPLENLVEARESGEILTASQWQARQPIHATSIARWQKLERELQPLIKVLGPVLPDSPSPGDRDQA